MVQFICLKVVKVMFKRKMQDNNKNIKTVELKSQDDLSDLKMGRTININDFTTFGHGSFFYCSCSNKTLHL
jgi:hypothetical protein